MHTTEHSDVASCGLCQSSNIESLQKHKTLTLITPTNSELTVDFDYVGKHCLDCDFEYTDHEYELVEEYAIDQEYLKNV